MRIRSPVLEISELVKIADILVQIADRETRKNSYKRAPDLDIRCTDGRGYKLNRTKDLEKILRDEISKIESLEFWYYGDRTTVRFSYDKNWGDVFLDMETSEKKDLLGLEDDLRQILKKTSWNWVAHNFGFHLLILLFFVAVFDIITLKILAHVFDKILYIGRVKVHLATVLNNIVPPAVGWPLLFLLFPKIYPKLVIISGNQKSGRELKKDLWKIFVGFLVLVLIPILINLTTR